MSAVADLLHIATPAEWAAARASGVVAPASLAAEGFVHCSTRDQLAGTLARHFAGGGDLVVLVLDPGALGAELRWEESRPGERYPHVYGPIPTAAVTAVEAVTAPAG